MVVLSQDISAQMPRVAANTSAIRTTSGVREVPRAGPVGMAISFRWERQGRGVSAPEVAVRAGPYAVLSIPGQCQTSSSALVQMCTGTGGRSGWTLGAPHGFSGCEPTNNRGHGATAEPVHTGIKSRPIRQSQGGSRPPRERANGRAHQRAISGTHHRGHRHVANEDGNVPCGSGAFQFGAEILDLRGQLRTRARYLLGPELLGDGAGA